VIAGFLREPDKKSGERARNARVILHLSDLDQPAMKKESRARAECRCCCSRLQKRNLFRKKRASRHGRQCDRDIALHKAKKKREKKKGEEREEIDEAGPAILFSSKRDPVSDR